MVEKISIEMERKDQLQLFQFELQMETVCQSPDHPNRKRVATLQESN